MTDPWTSAAPARAHLDALRERGIGLDRVAALTGLHPAHVQRIRNGTAHRVRQSTAALVLQCRPLPAPGAIRPAGRARQLLRWFLAEGFTPSTLATRIGVHRQTAGVYLDHVTANTELRLAAFRRALAE